jgi:hypothetical protein
MIIGSDNTLLIGERGVGVSETNGTPHNEQPFVVLREATFEEWLQEAIADGMPEALLHKAALAAQEGARFYEISVD